MVSNERSSEDFLPVGLVPRPQMAKASSFCKHGKKIGGYRKSYSAGKESSASCRFMAGSSRQLKDILGEIKVTTVTFGLKKTKFIEPRNWSNVNKEDLWWSRDELKSSRANAKELVAAESDASVQDYLTAYNNSYCMVNKDRKMTSDCLKGLVEGLRKGHRGLEDCVKRPGFVRSTANISSQVSAVVKYYHDCCKKEGYKGGFHRQSSLSSLLRADSSRSISSGDSSQSSGQSNIDRSVRSFSTKLSAGNRHFAQSMGRAECLAVGSRG